MCKTQRILRVAAVLVMGWQSFLAVRAQSGPDYVPIYPNPDQFSFIQRQLTIKSAFTNAIQANAVTAIAAATNAVLASATNLAQQNVAAIKNGQVGPVSPLDSVIIFEGDSLTSTANTNAYASLFATAWPGYTLTNYAVAGNGIGTLQTRWTSTVGPFIAAQSKPVLFSVWVGANDYMWGTAASFCANLSNYWSAAKASNATVVAFTVLPRYTYDGMTDGNLGTLFLINDFIRKSTNWDYLVDVAALFPNNFDSSYGSDHVHLSDIGQARLYQCFDATLRATKCTRFIPPVEQFGTNYFRFTSAGVIAKRSNPDAFLDQLASLEVKTNIFCFSPLHRRFLLTVSDTGILFVSRSETNTPLTIGTPESYYIASDWITNNVNTATLVDRWQGWNLTNYYPTHWPSAGAGLNGQATLAFTDSLHGLACNTFTNGGSQEIWMVISNRVGNAANKYIFDSSNVSFRRYGQDGGATNALLIGATTGSVTGASDVDMTEGKWHVLTFVWYGTTAQIWTNNSLYASGSVTAGTMSGFTLAAAYNASNAAKIELAEIATYSATNSPANRAALYSYFTNKYAISP